MSLNNHKTILAIGAHTDDIEMGCAGLIARLTDIDANVNIAIMSKCDDQFSEDEKGKLVEECHRSSDILRIGKTYLYDFPNKELPEHRIEIMNNFNNLQKEVQPDLILMPSLNDPHQDHSEVAHCAVRTFRGTETILQYEILRHGSHTFMPTLFVDISKYIDTKVKALCCYKSQMERRAYFDEESFRALARTRGAQSGYNYAEGFVIYKMFW